ncbi:MAG: HlyD family efflux transporter periplasmic adaptor subunit, partial [Ardenticatenales bacterium]
AIPLAMLAAVAIAAAGCSGNDAASQPPGSQPQTPGAGTMAASTAQSGPGTPGVRSTTVASRAIERGVSRVVTADGALELPAPPQTLAFPKPGTVLEVNVSEGQAIKAGDVLATMDAAPYQVELAGAEVESATSAAALRKAQSGSALETAKQDLERAKNQLWSQQISRDGQCQLAKIKAENDPNRDRGDNDKGKSTECEAANALVQASEASLHVAEINLSTVEQSAADDLAVARARVHQAQVSLAQARDNVARAELKAPFDGAVVAVSVSAGAPAGAGPAMTVARTSPLTFVTSNLSERYVGDVREGARAMVTLTAYPDKTLSGTVRHVAANGTVDAGGGVVFKIYIDLDNADLPVYAGMTGRVEIDAGSIASQAGQGGVGVAAGGFGDAGTTGANAESGTSDASAAPKHPTTTAATAEVAP